MLNKLPVYWDSCGFLDRIQRKAIRIGVLETITEAAKAGEILIVTSAITLAEVIKLPELGPLSPEQVQTIADFFENPWISVRLVDPVIAAAAAELRRTQQVKTCDALHIATAIYYQVPLLHTYDGLADDGTVKGGMLALHGVLGGSAKLRIEPPSDPRPPPVGADQPALFRDPGK